MRRAEVAIVGAGPAGAACAVQCQRLGVPPLLLDRTGRAGGLIENAHCVENYPGLEEPVAGPVFAQRIRAHLARFEVPVERATVRRVVPHKEGLLLEGDGCEILARAVVVACGTEPVRLGVAEEEVLEGVRLFYDVCSLRARLASPRRVLVVGGGEAACDYALSLADAGTRVELVTRGPELKARGRLARRVRESAMICVHLCVAESPAGLSAWNEADAVLVAVGRRPGDLVPPSAPGVFVAGDARTGVLGQVGVAVGDGLAAAAMAVAFLER
jgi:thioredoxin reductase (NADPH)